MRYRYSPEISHSLYASLATQLVGSDTALEKRHLSTVVGEGCIGYACNQVERRAAAMAASHSRKSPKGRERCSGAQIRESDALHSYRIKIFELLETKR